MTDIPQHIVRSGFGLDHAGNEVDSQDTFILRIKAMDPAMFAVERAKTLQPVLRSLVDLPVAQADAYVQEIIKEHFGLKTQEIRSLMNELTDYRKQEAKAQRAKDDSGDHDCKPTPCAQFDGLVDLVEYYGRAAFLIKEGDSLCIETSVDRDGVTLVPPNKKQIPWLLPSGSNVLEQWKRECSATVTEADALLFDDLAEHLRIISELPDERYFTLNAAWIMHTYLQEACQYSPVICLFALPERGKSRTGKAMIYAAYRGVYVESLREAYLFRIADRFSASIFFDVMDLWRKAERTGSEDLLLLRFEKGPTVARVLCPDKVGFDDTKYFKIFGPTIIGTNRSVHQILDSRAIQINMPASSRCFENDVTPGQALPLRERLLCFRARHMNEALPSMKKQTNGRLGDITKPLLQIMRLVRPTKEIELLELIQSTEEQRRSAKSDTLEGVLVQAIIGLKQQVVNGLLPVKQITDTINKDRPEREKITTQRVGRKLKVMNFDKGKTQTGASAIVWNDEKMGFLEAEYGMKETSVTSETSVISSDPSSNTDITDDTDVLRRS